MDKVWESHFLWRTGFCYGGYCGNISKWLIFSLSSANPRVVFLYFHFENLVGFLEVKPTKGWRPPSISSSYIQPLAIHIYHLGSLTNVWLLWLLFQVTFRICLSFQIVITQSQTQRKRLRSSSQIVIMVSPETSILRWVKLKLLVVRLSSFFF